MPTLSNEELKKNIISMLCDCDIQNSGYVTGTEFDYDMAADAVLKLLATQNTALLKEVAEDMEALDNYNEHDDSVALYLKKKWGERSKLAAMGGQS